MTTSLWLRLHHRDREHEEVRATYRMRIQPPTTGALLGNASSGSAPSSGWWPISSPPRHLTSTSGQRTKNAECCECCNNRKSQRNHWSPIRKGAIRHGSPLLEARSPSDEFVIAQLDARTYVACTTTDFVWISSAKLDGGLVRPHRLWSTRRGAMHSPSGSLLTTRVNMFLLTGEALTITSQTLSSYSSAFDRFEGPSTCVGRPTLVVRTESQRRFGFSKPS
jgi:hypothetical protein